MNSPFRFATAIRFSKNVAYKTQKACSEILNQEQSAVNKSYFQSTYMV